MLCSAGIFPCSVCTRLGRLRDTKHRLPGRTRPSRIALRIATIAGNERRGAGLGGADVPRPRGDLAARVDVVPRGASQSERECPALSDDGHRRGAHLRHRRAGRSLRLGQRYGASAGKRRRLAAVSGEGAGHELPVRAGLLGASQGGTANRVTRPVGCLDRTGNADRSSGPRRHGRAEGDLVPHLDPGPSLRRSGIAGFLLLRFLFPLVTPLDRGRHPPFRGGDDRAAGDQLPRLLAGAGEPRGQRRCRICRIRAHTRRARMAHPRATCLPCLLRRPARRAAGPLRIHRRDAHVGARFLCISRLPPTATSRPVRARRGHRRLRPAFLQLEVLRQPADAAAQVPGEPGLRAVPHPRRLRRGAAGSARGEHHLLRARLRNLQHHPAARRGLPGHPLRRAPGDRHAGGAAARPHLGVRLPRR